MQGGYELLTNMGMILQALSLKKVNPHSRGSLESWERVFHISLFVVEIFRGGMHLSRMVKFSLVLEHELSLVQVEKCQSPTKHVRCHPGGLSNQHHGKGFRRKNKPWRNGKRFSPPPKPMEIFCKQIPYGSQVPLIKNHFASLKIAAVIYTKYNRIYFTPTICPPSPLKSSELDSLTFLYK